MLRNLPCYCLQDFFCDWDIFLRDDFKQEAKASEDRCLYAGNGSSPETDTFTYSGRGKKNPAHAPAVWVTVKRTQGRDAFGKAYQSDVLTFGSPFPPSSVTTDTEDLETEGRRETGWSYRVHAAEFRRDVIVEIRLKGGCNFGLTLRAALKEAW